MTITQPSTRKSTIVRATGSLRLASLRGAFSVLDRIAPWAGGRWAARLWCTLPANAGRRRDERPERLPSRTTQITAASGSSIVAESWGEGPPVYLVHGWGGWRGQLGAFVEPLVERGFQVVASDSFSHGESGPGRYGPRRSHGQEMMEALETTVGAFGPPAGIVGHSLGAAVVAWSLDAGMPAPPRVALVAPTRGPMGYIGGIVRMLGLRPKTHVAMLDRLERMLNRPPSEFDVVSVAHRMPPALIVHDRKDKEVRYSEGMEIAGAWPQAQVITTDGFGHQRILRDPDVVTAIADYVTQH